VGIFRCFNLKFNLSHWFSSFLLLLQLLQLLHQKKRRLLTGKGYREGCIFRCNKCNVRNIQPIPSGAKVSFTHKVSNILASVSSQTTLHPYG
jgi:hypothetical protein